MRIRDARESDLSALKAIMNHYRQNTHYNWDKTPLTDGDMQGWLREHTAFPYAALVAEENGEIMGYASLSAFRPHTGYRYTAENSVYAAPGREGSGAGRALLSALLERAKENGLRVITAWIDAENVRSILFHERRGFSRIGTMRGAGTLEGRRRDVVILQYDIPSAP
ncbi:MAG TPA: GNAT family N-acetyltransferase [Feifaniaceae bacterium]|nr:GNAT family N-acetyltransferase [Feifaniaceae bacterium]